MKVGSVQELDLRFGLLECSATELLSRDVQAYSQPNGSSKASRRTTSMHHVQAESGVFTC